jgi:catechol 2,3-dioxygenase-like lactoylglutathione lyase family enzyme
MEDAITNMVESYERGRISRRELIAALAMLVAAPRLAPAAPASTFKGLGFNHLALGVTDIARSRDFYMKHLGMNLLRESSGDCFLGLGPDFLALFKRPKAEMDHFCIAIENYEVAAVTEELKRQGLIPRQPSGTRRVYFPDPDGLTVQLSSASHGPDM